MDKLLFDVIDPKTGQYPDCEKIALTEEWAEEMRYCDIGDFLLDENGVLYMQDDRAVDCPPGRFEIVWREGVERGQTNS